MLYYCYDHYYDYYYYIIIVIIIWLLLFIYTAIGNQCLNLLCILRSGLRAKTPTCNGARLGPIGVYVCLCVGLNPSLAYKKYRHFDTACVCVCMRVREWIRVVIETMTSKRDMTVIYVVCMYMCVYICWCVFVCVFVFVLRLNGVICEVG